MSVRVYVRMCVERYTCVLREGTCVRREGTCVLREGTCVRREGTCVLREGTCVLREGTCARREGTCVRREGTCVRREGTCVRREGGAYLELPDVLHRHSLHNKGSHSVHVSCLSQSMHNLLHLAIETIWTPSSACVCWCVCMTGNASDNQLAITNLSCNSHWHHSNTIHYYFITWANRVNVLPFLVYNPTLHMHAGT